MGAKIQAFENFQTPISSYYPLPLMYKSLFYPFKSSVFSYSSLKYILSIKVPNKDSKKSYLTK